MRNVLCFGDSNTYGYNPKDGSRYAPSVRWTGILKEKVKENDIDIIEEGLVGRTTVFEDSVRPGRKGSDFLVPLIETHGPVDTLVLMLGTNDCKTLYKASAHVIGMGIEKLIKQARGYNKQIHILLVSPIALGEEVWKEEFDPEFNEESVVVSKKLPLVYRKLAEKYHCDFLAASDYASPSPIDMEHLSEQGHSDLAEAIYQKLVS